MTEVVRVDPEQPEDEAIRRAAAVLRRGGLVAFPTETVYGLGVHALDRPAVRRLFEAKQRPAADPLIVHVLSLADADPLLDAIPASAHLLAAAFWPGPLTVIMRRSARVPDEITAGLAGVAIRVPAHPVARALLQAAAIPIAAPSANLFSRPSPTRASHVVDDLDGRIDMVIDGGPTSVGVESTVLDLSRDVPTILRPGAVTAEMLRNVLSEVRTAAAATLASEGDAMPSPGLLEKHYSPRAPLTLYEGPAALETMSAAARAALAGGKRVGLLIGSGDAAAIGALVRASGGDAHVVALDTADGLAHVAAGLYAGLRELDQRQVDLILASAFPTASGLGVAIADRLRRAAAGRIVVR
jgi:L-threonylcarbamoyladenylate synthase